MAQWVMFCCTVGPTSGHVLTQFISGKGPHKQIQTSVAHVNRERFPKCDFLKPTRSDRLERPQRALTVEVDTPAVDDPVAANDDQIDLWPQ